MNFRSRIQTTTPLYFHVTPFVDILLVLLAYFALTWSLKPKDSEIKIALPEEKNAQPSADAARRIIVNINQDGTVIINNAEFKREDLQSFFQELAEINPNQTIIVRADKATDYENVIQVLDFCREAGIMNVGFATAPEKS